MNGQVIRLVGDHNHEPIDSAGAIIEARTTMSYAAKQTINPITVIDIYIYVKVNVMKKIKTTIP
jgi:hypothetical protein